MRVAVSGFQLSRRPSNVPIAATEAERNTAVVRRALVSARARTVQSTKRQRRAWPSEAVVSSTPESDGLNATDVTLSGCGSERMHVPVCGCQRRADRSMDAEARKLDGEKER